jgi:hypothetical protein|tara:strand:+ start:44 stop:277 length:234 start_codon:yes stop_codon:yes gene_type:complete
MPALKMFFKERVEAKHFDRVNMAWKPGHDPTLVLFDTAGEEASVVNVEKHTAEQLRDLLVGYGFTERVPLETANADL